MTTSNTANSATQRSLPRSAGSAPARQASTTRTAPPSTTRDHATKPGDSPPSTATLMNRYGTPQTTDITPKPAQARALTSDTLAEAARAAGWRRGESNPQLGRAKAACSH